MSSPRLVITGANGFVGRYVVAEGLRRGFRVGAVLRPTTATSSLGSLADHPALEILRGDLRHPKGLDGQLHHDDVVLHLAASKGGDFGTRFAGTVLATEHLLANADAAGVRDLVAVSTFSIYDQSAVKAGSAFDENVPLIAEPNKRDDYAKTKLVQETLYREWGDATVAVGPDAGSPHRMVIVRPGMIWGREELWHALLGSPLGPRFLRIGKSATLPLIYTENVADALITAAEALIDPDRAADAHGQTVNLVDDDLPTQDAYVDALAARGFDVPASVTVPWSMWRAAAGAGDLVNRALFDGNMKLPGIVVPEQLDARFKPFRYPNERAKHVLGWRPRHDFHTAMDRAMSTDDLLSIDTTVNAAS